MARHKATKVIVVIDGERHIFEGDITASLVKTRTSGKPTARLEITVPLEAVVATDAEGKKYVRALNTVLT